MKFPEGETDQGEEHFALLACHLDMNAPRLVVRFDHRRCIKHGILQDNPAAPAQTVLDLVVPFDNETRHDGGRQEVLITQYKAKRILVCKGKGRLCHIRVAAGIRTSLSFSS